MEKYIKEYLLKYSRLQVSDFGILEIVYKASYIHPILHTFSVPGKYVVFSENKQHDDDFAFFVARKERFTVEEAQKFIENWVQEIRKTINGEKKQYPLSTLGSFFINAMGRIEFAAVLDTDISPQSYGLEEFKVKIPTSSLEKPIEQSKEVKPVILPPKEKPIPPVIEPIVEKEAPAIVENEIEEEIQEEERPPKKKKRIGWWIFLLLLLACGIFMGVIYVAFPTTFCVYKDKALACYDDLKAKISKNDTAPLEAVEDTEAPDN